MEISHLLFSFHSEVARLDLLDLPIHLFHTNNFESNTGEIIIILLNCFCDTTPLILPTLHIHSLYFMEIIIKAILVRLYYIVILFLVFAIQHLPLTLPWVTSTNMVKVTIFV